jgi:hypothetical protein
MSSEAVMNSANNSNSVYTSPAIASRRADQEQRLRKAFRYVYVCTHYTTIQHMHYRAHACSVDTLNL